MSETTATELLEAVQTFMRDKLLPSLEGFNAYTTRVAVNSLGIVARQLENQAELEELDGVMAKALGLSAEQGSIASQISRLLKSGELSVDGDLYAYFKRRTLIKMAIDNPKYSGYKQAHSQWQECSGSSKPE